MSLDPNNRMYIALYPADEVGYEKQIKPAMDKLEPGIPFSFIIDVIHDAAGGQSAQAQIGNVQTMGTDYTALPDFKGAVLFEYLKTSKASAEPLPGNYAAMENFKPLPEPSGSLLFVAAGSVVAGMASARRRRRAD